MATAIKRPVKRKQEKVEKPVQITYKCTCCGEEYKLLNGKFFRNYSPMFRSNDGYNTVCATCMTRDYESYLGLYGNSQQAIKRMCEKYDYYYEREIAEAVSGISDLKKAFGKYISKLMLAGHKDRTYDSTLDEDYAHSKIMNATDASLTQIEVEDDIDDEAISTAEMAKKWGYGYTLEQYSWLEAEYLSWVTRNECKSKSQEDLFILLCQQRLDIFEARRNNAGAKEIESLTKNYLSLLDSAKLQPKQEGISQDDEIATMGTWIKMIENKEPIPEPDEAWQDVDGIKRLIQIFVGGIAKMMGVQNEFVEDYQDMLDEYTVEVSDIEAEDDSVEDEDYEDYDDYDEDELDEESGS